MTSSPRPAPEKAAAPAASRTAPTADRSAAAGWLEFWAADHPIYVNRRHGEVHCRRIAGDVSAYFRDLRDPVVLDWGCGDSLSAPWLAGFCRELLLYDAVAPVRARLHARFDGTPRIRVLEPDQWTALPDASVDAAICVSVAQYMSRAEFSALLAAFGRVVRPEGRLILGDIVPPTATKLTDTLALLETAVGHGFFWAAIHGLVRTVFSDYRRLSGGLGFSRYTPAEVIALLADHGFDGIELPVNIGFNRWRVSFLARKRKSRDAAQ